VPPAVAARRDHPVEARSAHAVAAAKRPLSVAIGTPAPGCTLPPATYSPGSFVAAVGRDSVSSSPCVAVPYSAPPDPGNLAANVSGVVTRAGSTDLTDSPQRSITRHVARSHASISLAVSHPSPP